MDKAKDKSRKPFIVSMQITPFTGTMRAIRILWLRWQPEQFPKHGRMPTDLWQCSPLMCPNCLILLLKNQKIC